MSFGQYGTLGNGGLGVGGVIAQVKTFGAPVNARVGRLRSGTHLLVQPSLEPITVEEAKAHERVDHDAEDELMAVLIGAAREQCEHITGISLMPQTWQKSMDCFPHGPIKLLHPRVNAISAVYYVDAATGQEVRLSPSLYVLENQSDLDAWLHPVAGSAWPVAANVSGSVRIVYHAGFANAAAVPFALKVWIKMAVGTFYAKREAVVVDKTVSKLPRGFYEGLLDRYRTYDF